MNGALTLSISYPRSWLLSLTETSRLPDKTTVGEYTGLVWRLEFPKEKPSNYYETLTAVWLVPSELDFKNWVVVIASLFTATGAGVGANAFREYLVSRQKSVDSKIQPSLEEP
jgi:hypothetical protein